MMTNLLKIIFLPVLVLALGAMGLAFANIDRTEFGGEFTKDFAWEKPTTDAEWAEDVKKESLHLKFSYQLEEMKTSHENKLAYQEAEFEKLKECPECFKWDIREELIESEDTGNIEELIESEFYSASSSIIFSYNKLLQSIERIDNEIRLRKTGYLKTVQRLKPGDKGRKGVSGTDSFGSKTRSPLGTTYYIDADCATPGDGTTPTCNGDADDSYDELDDFAEVARNAGDVAILRRGTTDEYSNLTDVAFASDGTLVNPIIVRADYSDIWGDFASSSQTYTPTWGSKTMEASATIAGIAANDWVYFQGEEALDFSYEVASVSGTTLTLFLTYKGELTGSGNTLNVMPDAPIWGDVARSSGGSLVLTADNNWYFQGLDLRSSDIGGTFDTASQKIFTLKDIIFQSDGGGDSWIAPLGYTFVRVDKLRVFNADMYQSQVAGQTVVTDAYIDLNNDSSNSSMPNHVDTVYIDIEIVNNNSTIELYNGSSIKTITYGSNIITDAVNYINTGTDGGAPAFFNIADLNGNVGSSTTFGDIQNTTSTAIPIMESDYSVPRSGGSSFSIKTVPSDMIGSSVPDAAITLFDYPIYADTTEKTYTVYFKSDTTTEWTTSPTADELYLECFYYGSASNAYRRTKHSTSTIDFTTDTDFDQSISITCQPSQAGVLYLRAKYEKTKEAAKSNIFYTDPKPLIL